MNFTEVFVSPPGDCRRMNHSARSEDDGLSSCHDNYRPTMQAASCGQQSGEECISLGGQKQRNPVAWGLVGTPGHLAPQTSVNGR